MAKIPTITMLRYVLLLCFAVVVGRLFLSIVKFHTNANNSYYMRSNNTNNRPTTNTMMMRSRRTVSKSGRKDSEQLQQEFHRYVTNKQKDKQKQDKKTTTIMKSLLSLDDVAQEPTTDTDTTTTTATVVVADNDNDKYSTKSTTVSTIKAKTTNGSSSSSSRAKDVVIARNTTTTIASSFMNDKNQKFVLKSSSSSSKAKSKSNTNTSTNNIDNNIDMTIIILSMDRFESLQRLVQSLLQAMYPPHDRIDIQIRFDRPQQYERFVGVSTTTTNTDNNTDTTTTIDTDSIETRAVQVIMYNTWREKIQRVEDYLKARWTCGQVSVIVSELNLGLAQSWFTSWRPSSKLDRALILEDDVEVSSIYYLWLQHAHDNYGYGYHHSRKQQYITNNKTNTAANANANATTIETTTTLRINKQGYDQYGTKHSKPYPQIPDLASICLPRQTLIPLKSQYHKSKQFKNGKSGIFPTEEPFLYSLLGSHGFSPLAHIWMEFLDFVQCSTNVHDYNKAKCDTKGNVEERKRAERALKTEKKAEVDIVLTDLVTSKWYTKNKRSMWTQHFIYFCHENQYYNLYRHTAATGGGSSARPRAFVTHWKENGEHFHNNHDTKATLTNKDDIQPLLQLDDIDHVMNFPTSNKLQRYDWGGNLVTYVDHLIRVHYGYSDGNPTNTTAHSSSKSGHRWLKKKQEQEQEQKLGIVKDSNNYLPPVVMSAAIGYSLDHFKKFIGTLREYYFGDVWLLISKESITTSNTEPSKIRKYLTDYAVKYMEYDVALIGGEVTKGAKWEKINRDRFKFFETVCNPIKYSLCLTTDFRDSIFQSNPFANIDRLMIPQTSSTSTMPAGILHVFEHNKIMSTWHYEKMKQKSCDLYDQYGKYLKKTQIINGGSIIASPHAYHRLVEYMTDLWKGCNDQVILNVLVRSNLLTQSTPVISSGKRATDDDQRHPIVVNVHPQGYGPINVLGRGGKILRNEKKGKFLNRNCIASPTVHQYDLVHCKK